MKRLVVRHAAPVRLCGGLLLGLAILLTAPHGSAQVTLPKPAIRPPGTTRPAPAAATTSTTFVPRFEAVAETRLLMEGLANANYRSVHRLLKNKPTEVGTWGFARGQAILIAETGNLLLLRPPRNTGRDTWMRLAMDMRDKATAVARAAAAQDHPKAKAALANLTTSCNRCHQTFRVPVKVAPEAEAPDRDAE
jgi:hypothetical protein